MIRALFVLSLVFFVQAYGQKIRGVMTYDYHLLNNFAGGGKKLASTGKTGVFGLEFYGGKYRVGVQMPVYYIWATYRENGEEVKYRDYVSGCGLNANLRIYKTQKIQVSTNFDICWEYNSVGEKDFDYVKKSAGVEIYPLKMASKHIFPYIGIGARDYMLKKTNSTDKKQSIKKSFAPYASIGLVYRL